jgi:dienelactone hydrolase
MGELCIKMRREPPPSYPGSAGREEQVQITTVTVDIRIYPDAKHAFRREGPNNHAEAATDGWKRTVGWLGNYLKP